MALSNFDGSPHLVTWELTRACQLHCRHCRARALRHRDSRELSAREVEEVLDSMRDFGRPPVLILTGGDPLERADLADIIKMAVSRGYPVALAPSVTPRLTEDVLVEWADLGVGAVSLSLDGVTPAVHDGFRGVPGTHARTEAMARAVVSSGLRLQINTTVSTFTEAELTAMGEYLPSLGVSSWEVFFIIPTGRAAAGPTWDGARQDRVLSWLADYRRKAAFRVTAVGAPQFVRYGGQTLSPDRPPVIREARGMLFINHVGDVYPSGYLPLSAGNVRERSVVDLYRNTDLFQGLRDPSRLQGRCGACAWKAVCGGSRARAYGITGDAWAEDPNCLLDA